MIDFPSYGGLRMPLASKICMGAGLVKKLLAFFIYRPDFLSIRIGALNSGTPPASFPPHSDMIQVKIRTLPGARAPEYQSGGSAGADLFALLEAPVSVGPGRVVLVPTGLFIELPDGYEAQIRPRSGLALKHGITILNTPGTIDSDYRGEVKIIVANFGEEAFIIENGMRIAQMVFARVYRGEFSDADALAETKRGGGGFGHTGL